MPALRCGMHFHTPSARKACRSSYTAPVSRSPVKFGTICYASVGSDVPAAIGSAPQTDQNVPTGHQSLHTSLYGDGGAEAHAAKDQLYRVRKDEDDGSVIVDMAEWLGDREGEKPLGVYAIYDSQGQLQYIGYSRNMVTAVRSHLARVGAERAARVRAMVFANKAMATREHLERQVAHWVQALAGSAAPPGNAADRELWDGTQGTPAKVMTEAEAQEYAEKAAKMKKAMGVDRQEEAAGAAAVESSDQIRENWRQAVEGGNWSEVIDKQTQQALGGSSSSSSSNGSSTSNNGSNGSSKSQPTAPASASQQPATAAAAGSRAAGSAAAAPVVSPFTQPGVHRTIGEKGGAAPKQMTVESVDSVLNEVRPYLMADGGDVEVVDVENGYIFLRLQGSCSTCASSAATMKMGIERALQAAFGDQLKDVVQVDKVDVVSASVENVNLHLDMLRGAISSFGGKVEVASVERGKAVVKYQGPPAIGKGVSAAIKDRFPEIKAVEMIGF